MAGVRQVGDWIGDRFEIFDIHEGGMSLVYVVNDHLGKSRRSVVALKTLKDELLGHKIRRSRFATECRLWVQLGQHPNIVQAHSVEIFDGKPYVVLELVQGGDLVRWIGTPRLDLAQSLRFGVQFCQGMDHAVRQGLSCHRDIKPGNLLITEEGVLKITDFGLARICEEMVAVRPELPDGSIPLADSPKTPQRIVFTDPRDQEIRPLSFTNPGPARAITSACTGPQGRHGQAHANHGGEGDLGTCRGPGGRQPTPDPVGSQAGNRCLHGPRAVPRSRLGRLPGRYLCLRCRAFRDDHRQASLPGQVARHARPPAFPLRTSLGRSVHPSFLGPRRQRRRSGGSALPEERPGRPFRHHVRAAQSHALASLPDRRQVSSGEPPRSRPRGCPVLNQATGVLSIIPPVVVLVLPPPARGRWGA